MDIFCKAETELKSQIIHITKRFIVLHDGYPLVCGHLLLIPKAHKTDFQELSSLENTEFYDLKNSVKAFLSKYYQEPVIFEHGGIAQTIPHAHLHFLPTDKSIRRLIEKVAEPVKNVTPPYLFYEDKAGSTYYHVTKPIVPGYLHNTFAQVLGRPTYGPDRAKESDRWIIQVKSLWDKWQEGK